MGKRELIALLGLSSWCLVVVGRLFLAVPRGCLQFVIVVFPDHTHLLFLMMKPICQRLYNATTHILRDNYWSQFTQYTFIFSRITKLMQVH